MKYKNVLFICLIICIIFSISSVYANDLNDTYIRQEEPMLEMSHDDRILSSNTGSFADLNNELKNANNELKLTRNYTYTDTDSNFQNGIEIRKNIVIDGNGFTINGNGKSKAFNIQTKTIILKNIHFENCNNDKGGAIYFYNVNNGEIINSTFTNNHGENGGSIFGHSSNLKIENSAFKQNYASREGGSIYVYNSILIIKSCDFERNHAKYLGGALYYSSSSGILENCEFRGNYLTNRITSPLEKQYIQEGCLINCDISNSDINIAIGGGLRTITKLEVNVTDNNVDITVINPNFYNRADFDGPGYYLAIEKYPFPTSHKSLLEKNSLKLYNNHATTSIDYIPIGLNQYRVYYSNFINEFYYYFNITKMGQSSISVTPISGQKGTDKLLKIEINDKSVYDNNKKGYVIFTIDGKTYNYPVINGESEFLIKLPNKVGTFNYKVTFHPYSDYIYSSSANLKIISKYKTKTTIKSITGYQGNKVKLTATVKDDDGNKIKKGKVIFKVNGKTYSANVKKGVASVTIKYPKAMLDKKNTITKGNYKYDTLHYKSTYECSVTFKGDDKYMSSSKTFKITSKGKTIKHKYRIYNYRTFTLPVKNTLKFYHKGQVVIAVGMKYLNKYKRLIVGVGDNDDRPVKFKVMKHYKKNGKWRWDNWFYCDEDHYMETNYGFAIKIDKIKVNCYSPYFVKIY
ncbi:MAG: hypothetical protein UIB63_06285 [Methanobrevibacter sp.]|uniref:hypothetical protein n=1 Tax=Methanobrevibacter sp. TaxID=66852 RepID=UPI002E7A07BF|nr:hypothetical protein [Methanobrevibacter sp.]MEE0942700.1 hypothetical protein [Methanobrevibacter sp.]